MDVIRSAKAVPPLIIMSSIHVKVRLPLGRSLGETQTTCLVIVGRLLLHFFLARVIVLVVIEICCLSFGSRGLLGRSLHKILGRRLGRHGGSLFRACSGSGGQKFFLDRPKASRRALRILESRNFGELLIVDLPWWLDLTYYRVVTIPNVYPEVKEG
jgi:hypothetical protein